ncbi:MAG TPA: DUF4105 domain-containing protein [Candidatus Wallbacteria bacterium]|nr:DUF4105 domain-containing protein [Candidatus Wallbacteria bacterium]
MQKNYSIRLALAFSILFLLIFQGFASAENNSSIRDAYEKYLKSYNEFKNAVNANLSEETIVKLSEKYKEDLENYKKISGNAPAEPADEQNAGAADDSQAARRAADASSSAAAATPLEKAIIELHSGDASKLDSVIATLEKISETSKNPGEAGRAKYELANAYVIKNNYGGAEKLFNAVISDAKNPMRENAKKAVETLNYLKKRGDYASAAANARLEAINKKAYYQNLSWKNPFTKIFAKFSEVKSSVKYRKIMADLKEYDGDGQKGFISTAKTFVTDLFKKRLRIDAADEKENKLIAGEVIWKKRQRIAALVDNNDGIYKIANVRWGFTGDGGKDEDETLPKWRTVTLNTNFVKEAYFVIKPFAPEWIAGHSFFMFEFDEAHPVVTEYGEKSYGFIMSMEARQKLGESYSFTGSFGVVYLLLSKEDYLQICSINGSRLVPYKLRLDDAQKKGLLVKSIEESLEERGMERYDLFENNCTNILFVMLNSVLPRENQFREWIIKKVLYNKLLAIPKAAPKFLKKHNLIAETMPTIYPDKNRAADNAGKPFTGADLEAAIKNGAEVKTIAASVKSKLLNAVNSGALDKNAFKNLFYDEETDMIIALNVPGALPEEGDKSAFSINETEFVKKLNSINSTEELKSYTENIFNAYIAAADKRMQVYPDISGYLKSDLQSIENRIK